MLLAFVPLPATLQNLICNASRPAYSPINSNQFRLGVIVAAFSLSLQKIFAAAALLSLS